MGNQTNYHLYYNLDEHLLIAGLGSINAFPFHRGSLNSQKMVTNVQQEQQVRKAAALLPFEFRNRCYKLSCKWHCRNDFLPCLHNLLALYLCAQLWVGCPRRGEKALSSLPTYWLVLGEMIMGWVQLFQQRGADEKLFFLRTGCVQGCILTPTPDTVSSGADISRKRWT